ncbi:MAG: DegT/DnrJ/EryC1/StrS family aminotransferase [Acidobacteriota bacterium]|nr:DegT/DnrJ/EryC1/StrS family aminotransferase [Acidobacteriota bacterium]
MSHKPSSVNVLPELPFLHLVPDDIGAVRVAIDRVLQRGIFELGQEMEAFETEFAGATGSAHCVGVGSGTDALALALRGLGVGPGDEVITTPLTAAFTALAIVMTGAKPVFADIDADRMTLSPSAVADAVSSKTAAIVPVHLYGQSADMPALMAVAARHDLVVVEDCCQAHMATCGGQPVGTFGEAAAFSFYPTKNLGALGDGGAMCTNSSQLADRVAALRDGGQTAKYLHTETGVNSRLDELQAAILRTRLPHLAERTERRRVIATAYRHGLVETSVTIPPELDAGHVYHLFPVLSTRRDTLQTYLRNLGIGTLVHYPTPVPRQPAFSRFTPSECPVADAACHQLLSLPLHPSLSDESVNRVCDAVSQFKPSFPD